LQDLHLLLLQNKILGLRPEDVLGEIRHRVHEEDIALLVIHTDPT
jgi:hypothetical protein